MQDDKPTKNHQVGPPFGFGKSINDYYNHYVSVADAKAAAFLAADLVLLQLLVPVSFATTSARIVHFASIGVLITATILNSTVLFPRLPKGSKGVIFWENVRGYSSLDAYQNALKNMDSHFIEMEFAQQNYHVSNVLHRKNRILRWAIIFTLLGAGASYFAYGM